MPKKHKIEGLEVLSVEADFPADQPPLLFVHGAFAGAWMWIDTFMPYLAQAGHPCYALSLRCHGQSTGFGDIDWVSVSDYADDVEKVMTWLNHQEGCNPVVIGHSMGGFVVQKVLERRALRGCILMCSVPPQGLVASQMNLIIQKPHLFAEINHILSASEAPETAVLREALFATDVDEKLLQSWLSKMRQESYRAIWDMSMFSLPQLRLFHKSPMLILGAEKDALIPPFLVQSTGQHYQLPVHIFEAMGHALTHEKGWQNVADFIHDWIVENEV